MKTVVVGCGAIGGIIAARLTRAGVDVTPVTGNEAVARALSRDGFVVHEMDGTTSRVTPVRAPVTALGARVGDGGFELCIVTTKATTLAAALGETRAWLAPGAAVLCCQNGLPDDLAAAVLGRERVLGGVVVFGATMTAPGQYAATSRGGIQVGRPFRDSPDERPAAATLARGLAVTTIPDLAAVRWSKLALNCATSTLGAISGVRLGEMLRLGWVRRLVLAVWAEVVAVAAASGVRLAPIRSTFDIAAMALTPDERAAMLGSPSLALKHAKLLAIGMKFRALRSSMLVALERGRAPEIDYLNGEIVRRGSALGVATPVNARLVQAVTRLFAGEERPSLALLRAIYDELGALRRPAA